MTSPNLVLTFTLAGDSRIHVKSAARIKVDGRGGLTLFDADKGREEWVSLGHVRSLTIQAAPTLSALPVGMIQ